MSKLIHANSKLQHQLGNFATNPNWLDGLPLAFKEEKFENETNIQKLSAIHSFLGNSQPPLDLGQRVMYLSSDEALRQLRHYPGTGGNYSGKRYEQNPEFSSLEINMKLFC